MKNLEIYGVQEINSKEIKNINGGNIGIALAVVGIYLALALYAHENHHG